MEEKVTSTFSGSIHKDSMTVRIGKDEYIIDQHAIDAIKGLIQFSKNAFNGYCGNDHLQECEENMYQAYEWLVSEFLDLIVTDAEQNKGLILKQKEQE